VIARLPTLRAWLPGLGITTSLAAWLSKSSVAVACPCAAAAHGMLWLRTHGHRTTTSHSVGIAAHESGIHAAPYLGLLPGAMLASALLVVVAVLRRRRSWTPSNRHMSQAPTALTQEEQR
jgi:hypothetical protein